MNYRNTKIYSRAIEVVELSHAMAQGLPRGMGYLADQGRRAASSVVLNFAEGCGKRSANERRRFFGMARASAYELAAVFDIALAVEAVEPELVARAHDVCDHVAAMLTRFP